MEAVRFMANEAIINIAFGMIGLLAAYATYGVSKLAVRAKAQTALITEEAARRRFESAIADVERLTTVTVSSIEQTTAKVLREAVKDGKVERHELEALAVGAKKKIMSAVSNEAKQIISDNLGSFDDYVAGLIEACVLKLKVLTGGRGA